MLSSLSVFSCGVLTVTFVITAHVLGDCPGDTGILRLYKELGCKAVKSDAEKCPISFSCPSAIQTPSKTCSVKGKTYTSGEKIPTSKGSCVAECRCTEAWPNMDRSSIVCAHIDCPEFLGEPIMDGCVRQYSLDACCSVGVKCPSVAQEDGKSQNATPTAAVVTPVSSFMCNVSGVLYPEGSVFYPDAPACTHCICTKDFTGSTTGPYCREISCDIELHYASDLQEGCTPVYFGDDGCCPIQFRCPSIDDTVVKSTKDAGKNLEGKEEGQCTFGNLTLSLGDRLSPAEYEECVDCSCQIPPYVSCTKLPNC